MNYITLYFQWCSKVNVCPAVVIIYHYLLQKQYACFQTHTYIYLQTFLNRFRRIMDTSQNAYQADTAALTLYLDEMERHLFSQGQQVLWY